MAKSRFLWATCFIHDRIEAKSNAHADDAVERAKARLERMVTMEVAKLAAPKVKKRLIHKVRPLSVSIRSGGDERSATRIGYWRSQRSRSSAA